MIVDNETYQTVRNHIRNSSYSRQAQDTMSNLSQDRLARIASDNTRDAQDELERCYRELRDPSPYDSDYSSIETLEELKSILDDANNQRANIYQNVRESRDLQRLIEDLEKWQTRQNRFYEIQELVEEIRNM